MAALTGIIILTAALKPLITTPFRPASLLPLYTEAFTAAAAARGKRSDATAAGPSSARDNDCVLWVGEGIGSLCWINRGGLFFLCGVGKEANPLLVFRFLEVFADVLTEYLGEITETQIKDNFDVVYQLLEEMLDEGYPLTTESNLLRDIVLPPTLLSKVLSAAGVSGLGGPALGQPFSSPIPWRRPGVKHSSAEIFFDFAESLALTLDRKGAVVRDERWGVLECNARLSGVPEISLHLGGGAIKGQGLHPCVRLGRYEKDGTLSFIPPDGRFRLMDYVIPPPAAGSAAGSTALSSNRSGGIEEQAGVRFRTRVRLNESGGTFELSIASTQPARPLENTVLRWNLGEGVVPAKTAVFGASAEDGARWEVEGGQTLVWRLGLIPPHSPPRTLSGSFTTAPSPSPSHSPSPFPSSSSPSPLPLTSNSNPTSTPLTPAANDGRPRPEPTISLTYTIHQHSLSGLRVGGLTGPGMAASDGPGGGAAGGGGGLGGGGGAGGPRAKVFRGMRSRVECAVWKRW